MKKYINNKALNFLLKTIILLLVLWAINKQVLEKENLDELWQEFIKQSQTGDLIWLLLAIILLPLNWIFETLKWQLLMSPVVKLPFWNSFKAILAGVALSIFTPNRIGEYAGRMILVKAKFNGQVIIATFVGSLSQLTALLTFGLGGLLYFSARFLNIDFVVLYGVLFIGIILLTLLLISYFNIDLIIPFLKRIPFISRFKRQLKALDVLKKYSATLLSKALLVSFFRYVTYSVQFYFLLKFFGISAPFFEALAGISTIFLVQTSMPLPPVLGLLTRGQVAIFVLSFLNGNEISVLAATYSLFMINLVLPSLIGAILILKTNILKSLGYEKPTD